MPGMDGIEAGRRIKKGSGPRKVPTVVMVTAYGREEVMTQAEAAGLEGFLIKPVNQSVLLNTIMEVFGRGGHRQFQPLAAQATPPGRDRVDPGGPPARGRGQRDQPAGGPGDPGVRRVRRGDRQQRPGGRGEGAVRPVRRGAHGHPDARDGRPAGHRGAAARRPVRRPADHRDDRARDGGGPRAEPPGRHERPRHQADRPRRALRRAAPVGPAGRAGGRHQDPALHSPTRRRDARPPGRVPRSCRGSTAPPA